MPSATQSFLNFLPKTPSNPAAPSAPKPPKPPEPTSPRNPYAFGGSGNPFALPGMGGLASLGTSLGGTGAGNFFQTLFGSLGSLGGAGGATPPGGSAGGGGGGGGGGGFNDPRASGWVGGTYGGIGGGRANGPADPAIWGSAQSKYGGYYDPNTFQGQPKLYWPTAENGGWTYDPSIPSVLAPVTDQDVADGVPLTAGAEGYIDYMTNQANWGTMLPGMGMTGSMMEVLDTFGTLNISNMDFYKRLIVNPGMSLQEFAAANNIGVPSDRNWVMRMYNNAMTFLQNGSISGSGTGGAGGNFFANYPSSYNAETGRFDATAANQAAQAYYGGANNQNYTNAAAANVLAQDLSQPGLTPAQQTQLLNQYDKSLAPPKGKK